MKKGIVINGRLTEELKDLLFQKGASVIKNRRKLCIEKQVLKRIYAENALRYVCIHKNILVLELVIGVRIIKVYTNVLNNQLCV